MAGTGGGCEDPLAKLVASVKQIIITNAFDTTPLPSRTEVRCIDKIVTHRVARKYCDLLPICSEHT